MPTVAQVLNRAVPALPGTHLYGTVSGAAAGGWLVALDTVADPDAPAATVLAVAAAGLTLAAGNRVIVLRSTAGTYVIGKL